MANKVSNDQFEEHEMQTVIEPEEVLVKGKRF